MKTRRFKALLAVIMLAAIAGITTTPNPVEAQSADATLSALAVADGTTALSFDHPAFASGKTDYYLSVATSVAQLTITPTTPQPSPTSTPAPPPSPTAAPTAGSRSTCRWARTPSR